MIELQPAFKGIPPESLSKIEGPDGPFYVALAGAPREVDVGHFYADHKYQFFIYANWVSLSDGGHDVEIKALAAKSMADGGGSPTIAAEDIDRLKANISKLFLERDFFNPKRPIRPEDRPRSVAFGRGL